MIHDDDSRVLVLHGKTGRDAGKSFRINEVPPVHMAGFILRLLAALRLAQQDDLMSLLQPAEGKSDLDGILRLLTGCDPAAVQSLIHDALAHIEVAADPKMPTAFRRLNVEDIREMSTLGEVLAGFARINVLPG